MNSDLLTKVAVLRAALDKLQAQATACECSPKLTVDSKWEHEGDTYQVVAMRYKGLLLYTLIDTKYLNHWSEPIAELDDRIFGHAGRRSFTYVP